MGAAGWVTNLAAQQLAGGVRFWSQDAHLQYSTAALVQRRWNIQQAVH